MKEKRELHFDEEITKIVIELSERSIQNLLRLQYTYHPRNSCCTILLVTWMLGKWEGGMYQRRPHESKQMHNTPRRSFVGRSRPVPNQTGHVIK